MTDKLIIIVLILSAGICGICGYDLFLNNNIGLDVKNLLGETESVKGKTKEVLFKLDDQTKMMEEIFVNQENLVSRISGIESKVGKVMNAQSSLNTKVNVLGDSSAEIARISSAIEGLVKDTQNSVGQQLTGIDGTLVSVSKEQSAHMSKIDAVKSDIAGMTKTLNDRIDMTQKAVGEVYKEQSKLKDANSQLGTAIDDLKEQIATVKKDVNELSDSEKSGFADLKNANEENSKGLETSVTENQKLLKQIIENRLTSLQSGVDDLRKYWDSTSLSVKDISTKVSKIETAVDKLAPAEKKVETAPAPAPEPAPKTEAKPASPGTTTAPSTSAPASKTEAPSVSPKDTKKPETKTSSAIESKPAGPGADVKPMNVPKAK